MLYATLLRSLLSMSLLSMSLLSMSLTGLFLYIGLLLGLLSLPFLPFGLPSPSSFLPFSLPSLLSILSSLLFSLLVSLFGLLSGDLFLCFLFCLLLLEGNLHFRLLTITTRTRLIYSSDDYSSTAIDSSTAFVSRIALGAYISLSLSTVSLGIRRVLSSTEYNNNSI